MSPAENWQPRVSDSARHSPLTNSRPSRQHLGGQAGGDHSGHPLPLLLVQRYQGTAKAQGHGSIDGVAGPQPVLRGNVGGMIRQRFVQRNQEQVGQMAQIGGKTMMI